MAGSALSDAIARLRMHREAMKDLAAQLAAERDAAAGPPAAPPEPTEEEQGS